MVKFIKTCYFVFMLFLTSSVFAQGLPQGPPNIGALRYNYGPSVMFDETDSKWKVWWCGPKLQNGAVVGGDSIWYSESPDNITWTPSTIVFNPAASGWDSYHVCDPSVLRNVVVGGVLRPYVLYYTGTDTTYGNGDHNGQVGVAYSTNGITWTRLARLSLPCETTTSYGCQHFSVVKLKVNTPDPAFGGRFVATYSQTKTDDTTGTYVVESPDGLTWWGNAGVPGSPAKRILFPPTFGSQYMSSGVDLMYDYYSSRFLMTFTAAEIGSNGVVKDYVFMLPAHWYGGMDTTNAAIKLADYIVSPYGSYVPGFFRAMTGYRPSAPRSQSILTMTSDRNIRGTNGVAQNTQLVWMFWL